MDFVQLRSCRQGDGGWDLSLASVERSSREALRVCQERARKQVAGAKGGVSSDASRRVSAISGSARELAKRTRAVGRWVVSGALDSTL